MDTAAFVASFTTLWLAVALMGMLLELLRGMPSRPEGRLCASIMYHQAFVEAFTGDLDVVAGVCRMMLLIGNHAEDVDDEFVDDISADEASDGSYGRVTLSNVAMNDDDVNDRAEMDFDDVVFSSLAGTTATEAAAYLQTGGNDASPADDILIALWDIADTAADGSDFTLQVGSEGAIQFS